jgi:hypothetical protein
MDTIKDAARYRKFMLPEIRPAAMTIHRQAKVCSDFKRYLSVLHAKYAKAAGTVRKASIYITIFLIPIIHY